MKIFMLLALFMGAASANTVGSFSFQTCNAEDPIQFTDLTVTPDPLELPGSAIVSLTVTSTVLITPPTGISVSLYKSVNETEWEYVPCTGKLGSCEFSDVCAILDYKFPGGEGCPQPLVDSGIGCNCPIAIGTYTLTDLVINLYAYPPAEVTDGDYRLEISATAAGKEISCVEMFLTIKVFQ